jgi:adenosine deaminase
MFDRKEVAGMKYGNCLIDLHLHLDGSLSPDIIRKLSRLQNETCTLNYQELEERLMVSEDCKSLDEYLEKFEFPGYYLQTKETISAAVSLLLEELHEQGLIYAEIRFAPQKHKERGLTQEEVVLAAIEGMKNAPIPASLILCLMRGDDTSSENLETVRLAEKYLHKGVAAIDLAGAEALYKTHLYKTFFDYASSHEIPFTIHAGEADGVESISYALLFGAKRLGHGVRAYESEALMKSIKEQNVTLELCPTSNLNTQIFTDLKEYPLRTFLSFGIPVTINTDNMSVSHTTLQKEYDKLIDIFHLTDEEIKQLLLNSVHASFASPEVKALLEDKIKDRID